MCKIDYRIVKEPAEIDPFEHILCISTSIKDPHSFSMLLMYKKLGL